MSARLEHHVQAQGGRFVSIGAKLAGTTLAIVAVVSACVYVGLSRYERRNLMDAKEASAVTVVRLFVATAVAPLTFGDEKGVEDAVAVLAADRDVLDASAWALSADGRELGDLLGTLHRGGARAAQPPLSASLVVRRLPDALVIDAPVMDPTGKRVGVVQAAFSLAHVQEAIAAMERRTLVMSVASSVLLAAVLMLVARRVILAPLARLVRAANALERGEVAQLSVVANDEIGALATAFAAMSSAIDSRERRIAERSRDMRRVLDNVEEGFVAVTPAGSLSEERSLVLELWFGPPAPGATLFQYFGLVAGESFGRWLSIGWGLVVDGVMPVEVAIDQLPTKFERLGRSYSVSYRPIFDDARGAGADSGAVSAVLVVVRDVTERVSRERAEERQHEMMVIFRHVMTDLADFDAFFHETERLLASLETVASIDESTLRRTVHTIKGNAAIFGLDSVARLCHVLETRMADLEAPPTDAELEPLRGAWSRVSSTYGSLRGDGGPRVYVDADEYRALLRSIAQGMPLSQVTGVLAGWGYERAESRMKSVGDQVNRVAESLGKGPVTVEATTTSLRLPPRRWAGFWSVFAHIVRNAVDHGIEPPERRRELGKPARAVIRMSFDVTSDEVAFRFGDDGAGIDWARLAVRAQACGLPTESREDLERAIFTDSVTTREQASTTSGRGLGMGAVLAWVEDQGGTIDIESSPGRGTTWTFRFPKTMLTERHDLDAPAASPAPASSKRTSRSPLAAHVA